MAKKTILGLDGKLYRNTGTYVSPVWHEVKNVKDLAYTLEKTEADASNRESKFGATRGSRRIVSIDFTMIRDPLDTDWLAFNDAWWNDTAPEVAVMDGDITADGTMGLRATVELLKFNHSENDDEVMTTAVSMKPARADNEPEWMEISE